MRKLMIAIAIVAMALAGCVSVESTRAQLNSKNDAEVQKAENNIYTIATTGKDPTGLIQFETRQQIEYVQLTSNQELLLRIIDESYQGDVIAAAVQKIDFSQKGVAHSFVLNRFARLNKIGDKRAAHLKAQVMSKLTQEELLDLIGREGLDVRKEDFVERLVAITDSPSILHRVIEGKIGSTSYYQVNSKAEEKLLSMLDKVTDAKMVEDLLEFRKRNSMDYLVEKSEDRSLLMKKLPEGKMIEMGMKDIKKADGIGALRSSLIISGCVKDSESKVTLLSSILDRISEFRDDYNRGWGWDNRHDDAVQKLFSALPVLTSDEMIKLLASDGMLVKRPILVGENYVLVGFREAEWNEKLK